MLEDIDATPATKVEATEILRLMLATERINKGKAQLEALELRMAVVSGELARNERELQAANAEMAAKYHLVPDDVVLEDGTIRRKASEAPVAQPG